MSRMLPVLLFGLVLNIFVNANGQAKEKTIKDKVKESQAAIQTNHVSIRKSKKISGKISSGIVSDNKAIDDEKKLYSGNLELVLAYDLSPKIKLISFMGMNKNLNADREFSLEDTKIRASFKKYDISDRLSLSPSSAIILPTSKKSKRVDELQFSLEVINPVLTWQQSSLLSFTFIPRVKMNFHDHTINRVNKTNDKYQVLSFYIVTLNLNDYYSVDTGLVYVNTWNYFGTQKDDKALTFIEVGHSLNTTSSIAFGVETGSRIQEFESAPNQGIDIVNSNTSSLYGKFEHRF